MHIKCYICHVCYVLKTDQTDEFSRFLKHFMQNYVNRFTVYLNCIFIKVLTLCSQVGCDVMRGNF